MNQSIMVSVICTAYNHENYIRHTIESIINQKTNFEFELIINDDASTDNTAKILKEYQNKYSNLRVVFRSENQYSKGLGKQTIFDLCDMAKGKYIAWCEGDDFFVSMDKLQKQVDALESNPEAIACIHSTYRVREKDEKIIGFRNPYIKKTILSIKDIIPSIGRLYSLNSLMCRKQALDNLRSDEIYRRCKVGDIAYALILGMQGDFIYLDEPLSAYRVAAKGSWTVRMSKDLVGQISYTSSVIEVLELFDARTDKLYHNEVEERINYYRFQRAFAERNLSEIGQLELRPYYKNLPFKTRCKFMLNCMWDSVLKRP